MAALEIRVQDIIIVGETLEKALQEVERLIREWFASEDRNPLTITLSKMEDRGPPALGINVFDAVSAKGGLA